MITYMEPLTPIQEKEVALLKTKIQEKETRKARLELNAMLNDMPEAEYDGSSDAAESMIDLPLDEN